MASDRQSLLEDYSGNSGGYGSRGDQSPKMFNIVDDYEVGSEYRSVPGAKSRKKPMERVKSFFLGDESMQHHYEDRNIYDNPHSMARDAQSLDDDTWNHGAISNDEAERRLKQHGTTNGLFLITNRFLFLCSDRNVRSYSVSRSFKI